jgi:hypothetical protein
MECTLLEVSFCPFMVSLMLIGMAVLMIVSLLVVILCILVLLIFHGNLGSKEFLLRPPQKKNTRL